MSSTHHRTRTRQTQAMRRIMDSVRIRASSSSSSNISNNNNSSRRSSSNNNSSSSSISIITTEGHFTISDRLALPSTILPIHSSNNNNIIACRRRNRAHTMSWLSNIPGLRRTMATRC
jgi:hypothetical protein